MGADALKGKIKNINTQTIKATYAAPAPKAPKMKTGKDLRSK